ncbi:MAG TPA: HAMP domain-containing protein [Thermoanaerobaculia bacterium]|jgi:HAMP domain-containing protein
MKRRRTSLATKALVLQVASVLAIAAAVALPRYLALRAQLYAGVETSAESLLQVLEDMLSTHPELQHVGALDPIIDRFAQKLPAVSRVSVIGADSLVIADSRSPEHVVGEASLIALLGAVDGTCSYGTSGNQPVLRCNRSLRGSYDAQRHTDIVAAAGVEMRLELTDAAVRHELRAEMAILVALLIPIGAATHLVIRRGFVRPIERLAAANSQFASGETPAPLVARGRDELGVLAVIFNEMVEARTAAMRQREAQLAAAQAEVKVLEGILPICASCKRIHTDKGDWQAVESYVRDHSEAEFSHGICPDCAARDWGPGVTS